MDPLLYARAQMEVSLGFHMIFAAMGIAMPLLLLLAEGLHLRTKEPHYLLLARRWGKATALLFAVGAVSGTALSFELGLLWPRLMAEAGSALGPAFALEGYAFFIEAIFIGLYLYGWQRLSPRGHLLTAVPVAISGLLSGVLVIAANAYMQCPDLGSPQCGMGPPAQGAGAVFRSPLWLPMALHGTLACYVAVGFAVAGIYAAGMLRGRRDAYHRSGMRLGMGMAAVAAVLQIASGDLSAKALHRYQPIKLAAMESVFQTGRGVPLLIGGLPDEEKQTVRLALHLPRGLSFLATLDPDAEIMGLDRVDRRLWPPVALTHIMFQVMVGCGFAMLGVGLLWALARWRRRDDDRRLLLLMVLAAPLGFIALEAGWVVTEVGRQPFTLYGALLTRDAVTPAPGVPLSFFGFTVLYLGLGAAVVVILRWLAGTPEGAQEVHHAA